MTLLAEIALIVLAAVGAAVCIACLPRSRARPPAPGGVAPPAAPEQLLAVERLVSNASASPVQVHAYLRPVLAEVTNQRLAARGRSLRQLSEPAGRELLGDDLWEIVRPGRAFPEDRYGPGISLATLDVILGRLEEL